MEGVEEWIVWIVMVESVDREKRSLAWGCHCIVEYFPCCPSILSNSSALILNDSSVLILSSSLELTFNTLNYDQLPPLSSIPHLKRRRQASQAEKD